MSEKGRVLSNHIHDATGNNCFILFAFFQFAQLKKCSESADKKGPFFAILDATTERTYNPREWV